MLIDVIGWSLKMIEVYIESNKKEMDDGVKEGEKSWKIATIQYVDKIVDLRDLSILNYSYMHLGFWNNY